MAVDQVTIAGHRPARASTAHELAASTFFSRRSPAGRVRRMQSWRRRAGRRAQNGRELRMESEAAARTRTSPAIGPSAWDWAEDVSAVRLPPPPRMPSFGPPFLSPVEPATNRQIPLESSPRAAASPRGFLLDPRAVARVLSASSTVAVHRESAPSPTLPRAPSKTPTAPAPKFRLRRSQLAMSSVALGALLGALLVLMTWRALGWGTTEPAPQNHQGAAENRR